MKPLSKKKKHELEHKQHALGDQMDSAYINAFPYAFINTKISSLFLILTFTYSFKNIH